MRDVNALVRIQRAVNFFNAFRVFRNKCGETSHIVCGATDNQRTPFPTGAVGDTEVVLRVNHQ